MEAAVQGNETIGNLSSVVGEAHSAIFAVDLACRHGGLSANHIEPDLGRGREIRWRGSIVRQADVDWLAVPDLLRDAPAERILASAILE